MIDSVLITWSTLQIAPINHHRRMTPLLLLLRDWTNQSGPFLFYIAFTLQYALLGIPPWNYTLIIEHTSHSALAPYPRRRRAGTVLMMGNPENSTRNLFPKQIYRSQCTRLRRSRPVHPAVHTLSIGLSQGAVCSNLRLRPYRISKISLYIQRCWLNLYLSVSIGHSISIAYCDDDEWRQNVIRANIKQATPVAQTEWGLCNVTWTVHDDDMTMVIIKWQSNNSCTCTLQFRDKCNSLVYEVSTDHSTTRLDWRLFSRCHQYYVVSLSFHSPVSGWAKD